MGQLPHDLTRRRFVSLLGALPFVGPALLAVGAKVARARTVLWGSEEHTQALAGLVYPILSQPPVKWFSLEPTEGLLDGAYRRTLGEEGELLSRKIDDEMIDQIVIEAFYRGEG